jgi:hypothetical protein
VSPPRTSGFSPLSWLWWPVAFAGWMLAAVVLAAEWVAGVGPDPDLDENGPLEPRGGPWKPLLGPGSHPRSPHCHTPLKRAENRLADDFASQAKRARG